MSASLTIKQARIFDLTLPQLRDRIRALPEAQQRPPGPVIVYRAYVGLPSIIIAKRNGASAEAWASIKSSLVEARLKGEISTDDKIELSFSDPIVFAYEVVQVGDIAKLAQAPDRRIQTPVLIGSQSPGENQIVIMGTGIKPNAPSYEVVAHENVKDLNTSGIFGEKGLINGSIEKAFKVYEKDIAAPEFDYKKASADDSLPKKYETWMNNPRMNQNFSNHLKTMLLVNSLRIEDYGISKIKADDFSKLYP